MQLRWPLPSRYTDITTVFGEILTDADGKPYPHAGIDVGCPDGTRVFAAHSGVVRREYTELGGNTVRLVGLFCTTRYCHLVNYLAAEGAQVAEGAEIATIGKSGSAWEGYHLHFEVIENGVKNDPLKMLEVPIMSKLALQFQNYPSWAKDTVAKHWPLTRDGWVMALNPPVPDMFSDTHTLGRSMWTPEGYLTCDAWESYIKSKGAAGGKEYFEFNLPYYQRRKGMVTAWQYMNEPIIWSDQDATNYRDGLHVWIGLMHQYGFMGVGGFFARGNPQLRVAVPGCNYLKIMGPALDECDYLAYHAYWRGRFKATDIWEALRYRLIGDELVSLGFKRPKWFITECGDDNGGGRVDGWRDDPAYGGSWPLYFSDLRAIDVEFKKDGVIAAFPFICGADPMWRSWELEQAQAEDVGAYVEGDYAVVDPPYEGLPEDETTTDPAVMSEKIRWWSEESQRQYEAGNVARANSIRISNIQLCYRLENLLKAA